MSGTIPEYDICRKRSDTHHEFFQLLIDGTGFDITGDTIEVSVDSLATPPGTTDPSTTQEFEMTTGGGQVVIPVGTTGLFNFGPDTSDADDTEPGTYYYDVQWVDATNSEKRTILKGKWVVEEDVTKG